VFESGRFARALGLLVINAVEPTLKACKTLTLLSKTFLFAINEQARFCDGDVQVEKVVVD
jgi:hypothetical protein